MVKGGQKIFSPYHTFSNVNSFINTFSSLKSSGRIASSANKIPAFVGSVSTKLQSARFHLESVLATKELVFSWQPTISGSTIGSTISPTASVFSPTQSDVCRNVDGFFENLSSAFDIFAQVINLVYFTSPFNEGDVSFDQIVGEMTRNYHREQLTQTLASLRRQQWYADFKMFRRCTHHRKIIQCKITTEYLFMQTTWPAVSDILLPDNPFKSQPTYFRNRRMRVFGNSIFLESLSAVDNAYSIMEARARTANRIPV